MKVRRARARRARVTAHPKSVTIDLGALYGGRGRGRHLLLQPELGIFGSLKLRLRERAGRAERRELSEPARDRSESCGRRRDRRLLRLRECCLELGDLRDRTRSHGR